MRLVRLKLRGAIGISKGLRLDEVEIDFNKFSNGLIVMVGENGKGKTTIIENLHPYRRLISRDGNLADHFFLKDSYRKLDFIYNDTHYSSEIFIDGDTRKVEAYLRENGHSLNDGKASSYDEIVEKVFGSPDLFFNSVFSAQKSMGLSELSAGKKRDLFYELLNLTRYEKFQEKAKSFLHQSELNRERVQEKINSCTNEINLLTQRELELSFAIEKSTLLKNLLHQLEVNLAELILKKGISEKRLNELIEAKKTNESVLKKIFNYEQEIELIRNEFKLKIQELTKEKDYLLSKLSNGNSSFELIRIEKKALEEEGLKLQKNSNSLKVENEIDELNSEQKTITDRILKLNSSLALEEEIKSVIKRKSELSKILEQSSKEEVEITNKSLELEQNKKAELGFLSSEYEELLKAKEKLSNNKSMLAIEKANKERLVESYQARINQIEEDVKIIKVVPCSTTVGEKCSFLNRAYKSQSELELVKTDFESKISTLEINLESLRTESLSIEQSIIELIKTITTKEKSIENKYSREFGVLAYQLDKMKITRSSSEVELKQISKNYPESSIEEIENSKREILLCKQKLVHLEELLTSKKLLAEETKQKEASQILAINEKINLLSFRVVEVENQIKRERETLIKDFEQKIKSAEEHFNLKSLHLELLINKEKQEIKEFVEEQIIAANQELEAILKNLANEQEEKNKLYKEVIETDTKIDLIRGEISSLNKKKEELEANLNNLEKLQTDIKEYSILSKAFDKTGIPILKLENSSVMITSLANELLASFENKFRIAFETTKLTKDKKKMKEVFDINVLDEDGLCELKNKSGGERVWIETSIQLALGILLRCQGKAHQTSFLDEQDGSLDLGNAFCYRAMIEKAHEKSGVHNTIIITHRPELVDLIDQKLVFDDSKIKLVA